MGHIEDYQKSEAQQKSPNPMLHRHSPPWHRCPASVPCVTHTRRGALEKAGHQHTSFSCILLARIGPLPRHTACLGMETLNLSEKWAEVGGVNFGSNGLTFSPSLLTGRLSSPSRDFYRKGLNRHLLRQIKPALELAL